MHVHLQFMSRKLKVVHITRVGLGWDLSSPNLVVVIVVNRVFPFGLVRLNEMGVPLSPTNPVPDRRRTRHGVSWVASVDGRSIDGSTARCMGPTSLATQRSLLSTVVLWVEGALFVICEQVEI